MEELELYKKAYELACAKLAYFTGSCPEDSWDVELDRCDMNCNNNSDGECYREYFLNEANNVAIRSDRT